MDDDKIERNTLIVMIIVMCFATLFAAAYVKADPVERCFDKFQNPKVPVKPIPEVVVKRGKVPSFVRRYRQLLAHAPRNYKALQVYRSKRIRPLVNWGTLGWEKAVAVVRHKDQIDLAMVFAHGVEEQSYYENPHLIQGDLEVHDRFAREMRCLRRRGESVGAFLEMIKLR